MIKAKIMSVLFESKFKTQAVVYIRDDITSLSAYIIGFVILGGRYIGKQVGDALLKRALHIRLFPKAMKIVKSIKSNF